MKATFKITTETIINILDQLNTKLEELPPTTSHGYRDGLQVAIDIIKDAIKPNDIPPTN